MISIRLRTLVLVLLGLLLVGDRKATPPDLDARMALTSRAKHPLQFEANRGQRSDDIRFFAQRGGATVDFTDEGATLNLRAKDGKTAVVALRVDGARPTMPMPTEALVTKTNYLRGNDRSKWITNVPNYGRVTYPDVRDGVDVVFHGEEGQLEYDFVVAPGVDPASISLAVVGADSIVPTMSGDLAIETSGGTIVQHKPRVYQEGASGDVREVEATYRVTQSGSVGFTVAAYDRARPLVIDPVIAYSTYLGTSAQESAGAQGNSDAPSNGHMVVDQTGNVYVVTTSIPPASSPDFPDALVAKLDPSGALLWTTYVGGSLDEVGNDIALDSAGHPFITGNTLSADFPGGPSPLAFSTASSQDIFVAELDVTGDTVLFGTRIDTACASAVPAACAPGGTGNGDSGYGIAVTDTTAYLTGQGGGATGSVAFVMAVDLPATTIEYYVPFADAIGRRVVVDGTGRAYAVADTADANTVLNAARTGNPNPGRTNKAFLVGLAPSGAVDYGTFLGDASVFAVEARGVAIGPSGTVYMAGYIEAPIGPVLFSCATGTPTSVPTAGAYQTSYGGVGAGFVARFDPSLSGPASIMFTTLLGGSVSTARDGIGDIVVDGAGLAYVTGQTSSSDFPTVPDTGTSSDAAGDAFVSVLSADGSQLLYSALYGGPGEDVGYGIQLFGGSIDLFGATASTTGFPIVNAEQPTYGGGAFDAFVASFQLDSLTITPPAASLKSGMTEQFAASGGLTASYTFSLVDNESGATITAAGLYTAGPFSGRDIVQVSNAEGQAASATVDVTNTASALAVTPAVSVIAPRGRAQLTVSGGLPPYVYRLSGSAGGTIDTTGGYTAGPNGAAAETITITDQSGQLVTAIVHTTPSLMVTAATTTTPPRGSVQLTATGGAGAYTWSATAGKVSNLGLFTAPNAEGPVTITVQDQLRNQASIQIAVGQSVAINPPVANVLPLGTVTFTATGGAGAPYRFALLTSPPVGGSIDQATGVFVAGAEGNVVETVIVSDHLGDSSVATINVGSAPVASTPPSSTTPSGPNAPPSSSSSGSAAADAGATTTTTGEKADDSGCTVGRTTRSTTRAPLAALLFAFAFVLRRRRR